MVILFPVILIILLLGALRGGTNFVLLLPMLLTLGAGVIFMAIAEKDAKKRSARNSVPVLPTDHLSRKMRSALRLQPPKRTAPSVGTATPLSRRGPGRRARSFGGSGTNRWPPQPPSVPPAS